MKYLLFYSLVLAFLSCSSDRSKNENIQAKQPGETNNLTQSKNSTDANTASDQDLALFKDVSDDVANQVIDGYLKIKDALVRSDVQEAKSAAEAVQQEIKLAESEGITIIREDIEHISNTESLEHQREHFNTLSQYVYALSKASDVNKKKLYKQYCSMAFNNTGAFWLSSSEEIRNPYFGDKMLKCGNVQETL